MLQRPLSIGPLTLAGLAGLGAAIVGFSDARPVLPPQRAWVRIVRVSLYESRWRHDFVVDYATGNGLPGEVVIPSDMFSCRVGDTLPTVQRGVSVSLPPPECRQGRGSAPWPVAAQDR